MSSTSLAQRTFRTVGESSVAERVAGAQDWIYRPVLEWAVRSPLHTDTLGHSVHPMLTDVTLGCWISASILDAAGGDGSRRSAEMLVAAGLVAAVPTAVAGAADWAELSGSDRRIGAIHSLGTDIATFLFLGSLVARMRGGHAAGSKLSLAGLAVMTGAGALGGHLALTRGTARRARAAVH